VGTPDEEVPVTESPLPTPEDAVVVDVGAGYPVAVSPGRFFVPQEQQRRATEVLAQRESTARVAPQLRSGAGGFVEFMLEDAQAATGSTDSGGESGEAPAPDQAPGTDPRVLLAVRTLEEVRALRQSGVEAQPDHLMLSHALTGYPMSGFPMSGFPMSGFPMSGFPTLGTLMGDVNGVVVGRISLASTSEPRSTGSPPGNTWPGTRTPPTRSTAEPASDPGDPQASFDQTGPIRVVVLDTGLADDRRRPQSLQPLSVDATDQPDTPDADGDRKLDLQAGHGTFIAGLIGRLVPGCSVVVRQVLSSHGLGCETELAARLYEYAGKVDLVNLSLGTYTPYYPRLLERAIRAVQLGIGEPQAQGAPARPAVVVASAGNDGTWLAPLPAALPDVVSVGALGPDGPADFTNYGPWVRACAPGTAVVSTFFSSLTDVLDADQPDYAGWARWSGTSFAAPIVVAALARAMAREGVGAGDAVGRVVDAPGLLRLPLLGTVVNIA
jgi:hypothetical protein